ncbi:MULTISPECIES: hypothetical protein [Nostocales]|uniref:Uncharacterized protein n=1 Tax=Tolypothrix bouteillei VB521301 TaxID=1479485 RepID=A0A0C1RA38_9CYAN
MVSQQDKTPEKVRIKDSYRERIFAESQRLGKSYLETLYFIVDCYFAFKQGALPVHSTQGVLPVHSTVVNYQPEPTEQNLPVVDEPTHIPDNLQVESVDGEEGFTLDWEL